MSLNPPLARALHGHLSRVAQALHASCVRLHTPEMFTRTSHEPCTPHVVKALHEPCTSPARARAPPAACSGLAHPLHKAARILGAPSVLRNPQPPLAHALHEQLPQLAQASHEPMHTSRREGLARASTLPTPCGSTRHVLLQPCTPLARPLHTHPIALARASTPPPPALHTSHSHPPTLQGPSAAPPPRCPSPVGAPPAPVPTVGGGGDQDGGDEEAAQGGGGARHGGGGAPRRLTGHRPGGEGEDVSGGVGGRGLRFTLPHPRHPPQPPL